MGELTIRRNRGFAPPQLIGAAKTEKPAAAGETRPVTRAQTSAVPAGLGQLLAQGGLAESRRTLQTGEALLAEVQDKLSRLAELAREASGGGTSEELQAELDQLRGELDRILTAAGDASLFLTGDASSSETVDALLSAAGGEALLPDWLVKGLSQGGLAP